MTEFDVSRIVPSTRDFAGAVRTQRSGLALIPLVENVDDVARMIALDVRALAAPNEETCFDAARACASIPIINIATAASAEACQRARFYGADAACLEAFAEHAKTVQSMRMMPVAHVASADAVAKALADDARVMLFSGDVAWVVAAAADIGKNVILVAHGVDPETLRSLEGKVDAAIVGATVHRSDAFEALLDELDG